MSLSGSGIHDYVFFKGRTMRFFGLVFFGNQLQAGPWFRDEGHFFRICEDIWKNTNPWYLRHCRCISGNFFENQQRFDIRVITGSLVSLIPLDTADTLPFQYPVGPPTPQKGRTVEAPDRTQKAKLGQCSRIWNRIFKFLGYDSGV